MDLAHDEPNYMLIFYWLAALTALEVGVTYMGLPKMLMIAILVGLAVAKAAMVAMYFMHLKFERRILAMIAMTPLVLCVFLALMLLPDSNAKGRVKPAAPATSPAESSVPTHGG